MTKVDALQKEKRRKKREGEREKERKREINAFITIMKHYEESTTGRGNQFCEFCESLLLLAGLSWSSSATGAAGTLFCSSWCVTCTIGSTTLTRLSSTVLLELLPSSQICTAIWSVPVNEMWQFVRLLLLLLLLLLFILSSVCRTCISSALFFCEDPKKRQKKKYFH